MSSEKIADRIKYIKGLSVDALLGYIKATEDMSNLSECDMMVAKMLRSFACDRLCELKKDEGSDYLHPSDAEAIDIIDASLFNGCSFLSPKCNSEFRETLRRWGRRLDSCLEIGCEPEE
jgi:hypothetical protein